MNKKVIFITAAASLISFAAMFATAWFTIPKGPIASSQPVPDGQQENKTMPLDIKPSATTSPIDSRLKQAMTEKQLRTLIYEVREKIKQYQDKFQELKQREQRLQVVQDTLKKDIEKLNNLRTELATTVATLKAEQDKLQKSKIEISKIEKSNLISIAAAYDKMDSEAAGRILANMTKGDKAKPDDAVKILYYMTERTKAKLLANLSNAEPKLAAYFCKKLKLISEKM